MTKNFWKDKRILITGASGFIGSNAVDYFVHLGARVTGVIHPNMLAKKVKINFGENLKKISLLKADLVNENEALRVSKNQEIVFNFAALDGSLSFKNEHSAEMFSINTRIVLNMLEASRKVKVKCFLLMSSSDIYDSSDKPISEGSPIGLSWEHKIDGYKLAKWTSELAAREFNRQYGLDVVILRPTNIYGPREEFEDRERIRFIPQAIRNVFKEEKPIEIWGDGKQERSYLYVGDFLRICSSLIERGAFNFPINVAGQKAVKLKDLAKRIVRLSGKEGKIKLDRSKFGGAAKRNFDLKLLKKFVDLKEETPLDLGLKETINFFKDNYL